MAAGPLTQVSDVVVPAIFTPYVQQFTEEKARLVQSGALARDAFIDNLLAGGGITFNVPSFRDLDNDADNVSTDDVSDVIAANYAAGTPNPRLDSTPLKIETDTEIAVRLSRNSSWSSADLASALAGEDPMSAIGSRVGFYWTRRLQAVYIATWQGVSKDNAANDAGDYAADIAGGAFVDGVTNFSAEAFIDAKLTMGDSMEDLSLVMVHSTVYSRMQKNNLIDFIPDARGEVNIPTFQGAMIIIDDNMPNGTAAVRGSGAAGTAGVFETWLFGSGASRLGVGSAKVPTEVHREPLAGNGGGQEVLTSRNEWTIHPVGHAYIGTSPNGGPGNGTGANQLNVAGSWDRRFPERKQIKFARLITRESA